MRKIARGAILCFTCILIFTLSACSLTSGKANKDAKEAEGTLKVLSYDEVTFLQQYGSVISKFPKLDIDVVETKEVVNQGGDYNQGIVDLVKKEKPDLIIANGDSFATMAEDGMLVNLQTLVKKDKFNIDGIYKPVLNHIRELGGGELYGLTPTFYTNALYYNKDLFDKYSIPYPTDSMTWSEVLQLAARFPSKDKVSGLAVNSLSDLLLQMGTTDGLQLVDQEEGKATMQTPLWKKKVEAAVSAYQAGLIAVQTEQNPDSFASNNAAMRVDSSSYINILKQNNASFQWNLTTAPVDAENRATTSGAVLGDLFSLNASSSNIDAAWKFMQAIVGEERAKTLVNINYALTVYTDLLKDRTDPNMEPFFKNEPVFQNWTNSLAGLPVQTFFTFPQKVQAEIEQVADRRKTAEQALQTLQDDLTKELLNKSVKAPTK